MLVFKEALTQRELHQCCLCSAWIKKLLRTVSVKDGFRGDWDTPSKDLGHPWWLPSKENYSIINYLYGTVM